MKKDKTIWWLMIPVGLGLAAIGTAWWLYESDRGLGSNSSMSASGVEVDSGKPRLVERATPEQLEAVRRALDMGGVIDLSIQRFRVGMGRLPHDLTELTHLPGDVPQGKRWDGPYINNSKLLEDPWGQAYRYRSPGIHNDNQYDLWSVGVDGVDQTSDDIVNWF